MDRQDIIIYKTSDGKSCVALTARDGNIWLKQKQLAQLFATSRPNISMHIDNILKEKELDRNSVCKDFLHTATYDKTTSVRHTALAMILAVGFRVAGPGGTRFRQWANRHLQEYMIKGFVIDDERLKTPDGRPDYFYQKIRDLFALCSDYDSSDKATQIFFAEIQNKLLFAVTHRTATELIVDRATADQANRGLTHWQGSIVRKQDISIAKNYLNPDEIDTLNRLVVIFLETAELRVKNRIDTTMDFWCQNTDQIIQSNDFELLRNKGSISKTEMERIALEQYQRFDHRRKAQGSPTRRRRGHGGAEAIGKQYQEKIEELNMNEYIPPKYKSTAFHCPYCRVYAKQDWITSYVGNLYPETINFPYNRVNEQNVKVLFLEPPPSPDLRRSSISPIQIDQQAVKVSLCSHCQNPTLWWNETIIYPPTRHGATGE